MKGGVTQSGSTTQKPTLERDGLQYGEMTGYQVVCMVVLSIVQNIETSTECFYDRRDSSGSYGYI